MSAEGVIHDIGYRRYDGVRLGRGYARRAFFLHGLRTAFGFGRSAKAKIFPWSVVAIALLVAAVVTAVRAQGGEVVLGYRAYPDAIALLVVLFCAVIGPELVSRDLRSGVLPLYFSRPLTRGDYALVKMAVVMTATWLLLALPLTVMFLGGALSLDGMREVWTELGHFAAGLGYAAICAALFGGIATLIGSLSGRRAVAAAIIAGYFLLSSAVAGTVMGIAAAVGNATLERLGGVLSPMMMTQGVRDWLFSMGPGDFDPLPAGDYGAVYGAATLGLIVVCALLLTLRYRKVAR